jgi:hypothetical protein
MEKEPESLAGHIPADVFANSVKRVKGRTCVGECTIRFRPTNAPIAEANDDDVSDWYEVGGEG